MDGADINESFSDAIGYNPAPEALEEIRVITSNADAEFGNVNGGEVLLSTKGGANKFHGNIYEYLENANLDANTWANKFNGLNKSSYTQNIFGAAFGGPIVRKKLFFFADYEGARYHTGGQGTASVAPMSFRTGDFSALPSSLQLYDSQNGFAPFTGNKGLPVRNPVALFLFANPAAYPLPNRAPLDGIAQSNYVGYSKSFTANNQGDLRIDYNLGAKDTIMGRYSMGDAYDGVVHSVLPVTFPAADDYPVNSLALNWTHTISNSIVNELRASFTRLVLGNTNLQDPSGLFGTTGNAKVGIPGPQTYNGFSLQSFSSGPTSFGTVADGYGKRDNNFDYTDNFTWQHGNHTRKLGAQFLRYQQNNFDPGNYGTLGQFNYTGQFTGNNPVVSSAIGYAFADFVLDYAEFAAVGGVRGFTGQRQWRDAAFAQDDWRLASNLTVNLGLRYQFDQPIYEVNNKEVSVNLANPSLGTAGLEYAGQNGNSRALYNPVYTGFQPRVGFAYQPRQGFVVRGGYGTTTALEGTGSSLRLTENPPIEHSFTAAASTPSKTSSGTPLLVTNGFATAPGNLTVANTTYYAWAANLRPAFTQEFSMTAEYEVDNQTSLQVGYVGQTGQHLIVPVDGNQYPAPSSSTTGTNAPFYNLVGQSGQVKITASEGMSNYNALQAVIRHRMAKGMEYAVNYTYGKSLTNNPGFYNVPGVDNATTYWQNANNPSAEYGPSGFDIRHNLSATGIYELPFGHNKRFGGSWSSMVDQAVGGWKITGSAMLYTGFPITITSPNNANMNALVARSNRYLPMKVVNRSVHHWFGTDPSATPCQGAFNSVCAYGAERGPRYEQVDLSFFKTLYIVPEGHSLDFRADFFNAFNIASYADPDRLVSDPVTTSGTSGFGSITSTRSPQRQIQFSAHYRF